MIDRQSSIIVKRKGSSLIPFFLSSIVNNRQRYFCRQSSPVVINRHQSSIVNRQSIVTGKVFDPVAGSRVDPGCYLVVGPVVGPVATWLLMLARLKQSENIFYFLFGELKIYPYL